MPNFDQAALHHRHDLRALTALLALWAALWALTWPVGEFPLNDDWVYALAVRSILDTGRFALPSPSASNVFTQAYWGALFCLPFGFSFAALRLSTFVLGGFGLVALFQLCRELGAPRATSLAASLCLAVNPLFVQLSASFMTDVPFTALSAGAVWLYVRGCNRHSRTALALAFVLAAAAILIRQFGLVLPAAFAVAHLARRGFGPRALALAALPLIAGLALHLGFEHWLVATGRILLVPAPISAMLPKSLFAFLRRSGQLMVPAIPYIGLFLAPLLLTLACVGRRPNARPSAFSRTDWLLGTGLGVALMAAILHAETPLPWLGNGLLRTGLGPLSLRDTYQLGLNQPPVPPIVATLWIALTALGAWVLGITTVIAGRIALSTASRLLRKDRSAPVWQHTLLLTLAAAYMAGLILLGVANGTFFDRYLIFLIVPLSALLTMAVPNTVPLARSPTRWLAALALPALSAIFATTATHDYLAWNRARLQATDGLLQSGIAPEHINGGYEFNGWHLYNTPIYLDHLAVSNWYSGDDEYLIASGPIPATPCPARSTLPAGGACNPPTSWSCTAPHRPEAQEGTRTPHPPSLRAKRSNPRIPPQNAHIRKQPGTIESQFSYLLCQGNL